MKPLLRRLLEFQRQVLLTVVNTSWFEAAVENLCELPERRLDIHETLLKLAAAIICVRSWNVGIGHTYNNVGFSYNVW
ncbi:hypothetical protein [Delftia acidovorans]|uniref:hypothetical protein n=1 Tax=Delftia acidovorans TaxID=80866 RepID=UPI00333E5995